MKNSTATRGRGEGIVIGRNVDTRPAGAPIIESVHRALELLKILQDGQTLSVTMAASALDVSPATAYRLLSTLRVAGFATQIADRSYRAVALTPQGKRACLTLAELNSAVDPVAHTVSEQLGETVVVWARRGHMLNLVSVNEASRRDTVPGERFDRFPAYATASGRVLLSELTNREVEDVHKSGLVPWRDSKITSLGTLKRRLSVIRREGYETTYEEAIQGTAGLAIPVRDPWDRAVAALAVAAPVGRVTKSEIGQMRAVLEQASSDVERRLRRTVAA